MWKITQCPCEVTNINILHFRTARSSIHYSTIYIVIGVFTQQTRKMAHAHTGRIKTSIDLNLILTFLETLQCSDPLKEIKLF